MALYSWHLTSVTDERWAWSPLFFPNECDQIISQCSELEKQRGILEQEVSTDKLDEVRKSDISWIPINKETEWIFRRCTDAVSTLNQKYFNFDLHYIENLQFSIYDGTKTEAYYKKHIDTMYHSPATRKMSFSILLSDQNSFTGGDLLLHTGHEPQVANRDQGVITAFNSMLLHEVSPVTSGIRYALVGWVVGPRWK